MVDFIPAPVKNAAWPVRNLYNMATADPKGDGLARSVNGDFSGGKLKPYHNSLTDVFSVFFGQAPKIVIAIIVWQCTVDMEAASVGYDWTLDGWVAKVVLRDLFLMVVVAGLWDWILYASPLKDVSLGGKTKSRK